MNQRILAIAWPMMIASLSVPLLGLVDTALLGHLDTVEFLGAVAIGANFIGLMYWSFGFLRMSTTSLVAQDLGLHRHVVKDQATVNHSDDQDSIVFRAMALGLTLGICICLAIPFLIDTALSLMQASNTVSPLAAEYIDIRRYSAPAALLTYAISGWLVGTQQPKKALAIVLLTNFLNIALDLLFIVQLDMQSKGAALATVIAEYSGLCFGLYWIAKDSRILQPSRWHRWLAPQKIMQMLAVNYHLLVRTLLLLFVFNFFTAQGSAISDNVLAANAILLQLVLLSAYVMDGFTHAAEALSGEAYGAKKWHALKQVVWHCGVWMSGTALAFAAMYALFGSPIIHLFSNSSEVLSIASDYALWIVVIPVIAVLAYLMDGIAIGTGKTQAMHYSMWFSTAMVFLPLWYCTTGWGNTGLWLAFACFNLARGLSLGGYYFYVSRRFQ